MERRQPASSPQQTPWRPPNGISEYEVSSKPIGGCKSGGPGGKGGRKQVTATEGGERVREETGAATSDVVIGCSHWG